jgi:hypothetical protein
MSWVLFKKKCKYKWKIFPITSSGQPKKRRLNTAFYITPGSNTWKLFLPWRWKQETPSKRNSSTKIHNVTFHNSIILVFTQIKIWSNKGKGKGKAVPLQVWSGPEGSRKLRFPHFITTAQDGGKFVSLTHRPPLPPGNTHGTHFC